MKRWICEDTEPGGCETVIIEAATWWDARVAYLGPSSPYTDQCAASPRIRVTELNELNKHP